MRVLLVTNLFPPVYTGGAEVSNFHTCQALIRRGVQCSVLFINNRMPQLLEQWYDFHGLPVHRVNFHTLRRSAVTDIFDWRIYRAMQRELQHIQPDLVHMTNMSGRHWRPMLPAVVRVYQWSTCCTICGCCAPIICSIGWIVHCAQHRQAAGRVCNASGAMTIGAQCHSDARCSKR